MTAATWTRREGKYIFLITALRVTGILLALASIGSVIAGAALLYGLLADSGSAGLAFVLLIGVTQWFWQALAGTALSCLCFAGAKLLAA